MVLGLNFLDIVHSPSNLYRFLCFVTLQLLGAQQLNDFHRFYPALQLLPLGMQYWCLHLSMYTLYSLTSSLFYLLIQACEVCKLPESFIGDFLTVTQIQQLIASFTQNPCRKIWKQYCSTKL